MSMYIPESIPNFRQLGGIKTQSGYLIKDNLIFRSAALHHATSKDIHFLNQLGLKTIVDFRSPGEIAQEPDPELAGTRALCISPFGEIAKEAAEEVHEHARDNSVLKKFIDEPYSLMAYQMRTFVRETESIAVYQRFIRMFLHKSNLPLLFHCRGGKDRAGMAAIFLLLILGVSEADILKDYMLTEKANEKRNAVKMAQYAQTIRDPKQLELRKALMVAREDYAYAALDEMKSVAGTYEQYIRDVLKISDREVEIIRQNCLINYPS